MLQKEGEALKILMQYHQVKTAQYEVSIRQPSEYDEDKQYPSYLYVGREEILHIKNYTKI
ncbi:hypothetical protein ACQKOF_17090 [Lysinibacillus sp. NPDC093190]|uniref:hypothetical protein n=1 Tax=Lysinibacillus sp. NPDC093190 TaxID=3390575 RepID=UPI003D0950B3